MDRLRPRKTHPKVFNSIIQSLTVAKQTVPNQPRIVQKRETIFAGMRGRPACNSREQACGSPSQSQSEADSNKNVLPLPLTLVLGGKRIGAQILIHRFPHQGSFLPKLQAFARKIAEIRGAKSEKSLVVKGKVVDADGGLCIAHKLFMALIITNMHTIF